MFCQQGSQDDQEPSILCFKFHLMNNQTLRFDYCFKAGNIRALTALPVPFSFSPDCLCPHLWVQLYVQPQARSMIYYSFISIHLIP